MTKILIIDDSPEDTEMLRRFCEQLRSSSIETAPSGSEVSMAVAGGVCQDRATRFR